MPERPNVRPAERPAQRKPARPARRPGPEPSARAAPRASASATSALASAGLRSVIAATVRLVEAFSKILSEQVAHDGIARAAAAAPHDHAHQMAVAPAHRCHEIEAGRAGVAGLDSVNALDGAEQMIVVADRMAAKGERHRRKVAIIAGKAVLNGAAKRSIDRAPSSPGRRRADRTHCDRPSWSCRERAPCGSSAWRNRLRSPAMASAITTAASLAERVTSPLMASSTRMVCPGRNPSLVGA